MLFSEPVFFAFFAVYFALHLIVPARNRIFLVIVGSTFFYAWWRIEYVWLPYALTLFAWVGLRWTCDAADPVVRRRRLILSLLVLFTPLVVVKYTYFFASNLAVLLPESAAGSQNFL